ncbi:MAG: ABC transporter ATP-binding protein [Coriobacteriia bacterium]|nr:ABC transporter ATP-binding protein [Coriobacteriia bacterium]
MSNVLEVRNLKKHYNSFALHDISFDVPRGYIMGFIGPNGAGKTTTIKLILSMVTADSGTVKCPNNERIGVVLDAPFYVDEWRVRDVEKALAPFYAQWDTFVYANYLSQFGLDANKKVKELSRGMKIKLQLAVALSHNAELLVLDEPTSGLDPVAREEICDLLRGFVSSEDKSVLFSTHITSDLEKTADFITFILKGNIVFTGQTDALTGKYARISGGLDDLTEAQQGLVIGYRPYCTGFEGMIELAHLTKMPSSVLVEEISLDEIIIYMTKEVGVHE